MFDVEKIRADFPLLSTEVYGRPLVYLDSGATAQKPRCVIDTVDYLHRELNANIHRGVHRLAEEATERYEAARDRIRAFIGAAHREEVIFTAGATASLNTVAYAWGDTFLRAGDNIVVSEMEHHSNLVPWQAVALRKGAELRMLPFDDAGRLMTERLDGLIDGRTRMVAVTQASNTLGTRPDLRPIVEAAHAVGALVCVDGCQGIVHGGADVHLNASVGGGEGNGFHGQRHRQVFPVQRLIQSRLEGFSCFSLGQAPNIHPGHGNAVGHPAMIGVKGGTDKEESHRRQRRNQHADHGHRDNSAGRNAFLRGIRGKMAV